MSPTPQHNVVSLLDHAAARVPGRNALCTRQESITFAALHQRVCRCANLLTQRGLRPGDRAIVMIPMSIDLYVTLLAIIRCGAAAVFVDPWIPMRSIAAFAAFAEPAAFVGIPRSHLLRLLAPALARLRITATTGRAMCGFPASFSLQALQSAAPEHTTASVDLDTPALITFTSGSSGIPKGANRTHGFLLAQYQALCANMDYGDADVDMPMFPVFALRNLAAGITSVIPAIDFRNVRDANAEQLNKQILQHGVSIVTASPPLIDQLAQLPQPPQLRRVITGGAPISDPQLRRWREAFPKTAIDIVYGSTEAEPVAHIGAEARLAAKHEEGFCCGSPVPDVETRVIKITRDPVSAEELEAMTLPQGKTGELLVAARHVCRDYFHNPEAVRANKVTTADGTCWHRMGDTGYFDDDGRFVLTGRVHTSIRRGDQLLHAQVVEAEAAKRLPDAIRIAALEEEGKLTLIVQAPPVPDAEQLLDADRVVFTRRQLPLDPRHNAKIDYGKLRVLLEKGRL